MSDMFEPTGELLGMDTQEKRERWLRFLVESRSDWSECQLVYNDDNLVLRVRFPDGEEVAFDCGLRRKMRIVAPEDERENN